VTEPASPEITFDAFLSVDIRVGTITSAVLNEAARKPAYRLEIDFGSVIGMRTSSAQLVDLYTPQDLVGRQVAAVVNFPPRQIARVVSQVLVLGIPDAERRVVLVSVERPVPNGGRMY
jgi:tRNA-binding protein